MYIYLSIYLFISYLGLNFPPDFRSPQVPPTPPQKESHVSAAPETAGDAMERLAELQGAVERKHRENIGKRWQNLWENHGNMWKTEGKQRENYGKPMGKGWTYLERIWKNNMGTCGA